MKILNWLLYIVGIGFCIAGVVGHLAAWGAAAMLFCAANVSRMSQKDRKK